MIGFNAILNTEGIDPKVVKLVRHQTIKYGRERTPFWLSHTSLPDFECYQRIQSTPVFKGAQIIASFVATPLKETLFIGLYRLKGLGRVPRGLIDPVTGKDAGGKHFYELVPMQELAEYREKLLVVWGAAFRTWVQLARKQDKKVLEIRRSAGDPPFPGFMEFSSALSALKNVPVAWRAALSSVGGIYLLTHPISGKQYVGSAYGAYGFWTRWEDYADSGHGGNVGMREIPKADYRISILEVASSSARAEDLFELEGCWKEKLHSRKFGLNKN